jgi:glycosyltransferase involved in cell wall biosynthesis
MTVTILVPIYGVEQYIAQCAESLFKQTYADIEYVFCNDSTSDNSIKILYEVLEYFPNRKAHVRIISNEKNEGIGATRAKLLSEVNSEYFFFADSDDVLPINAIKILVNKIQQIDADIVEGAYAEYNNGTVSGSFLPCHDDADGYFNKALCQNVISLRVWGKLYTSGVISKVSPLFFDGIDFAEDVCATSRLAAVTSRSFTDEVVYWYRTDNTSSYTKNIDKKNILSYFRAMKQVLSFYHMRGHLPLSLEIGVLNCYRECRKSGIPPREADHILRYFPEHISAKLLYGMFRSSILPLWFSDFIYRLIRYLVAK